MDVVAANLICRVSSDRRLVSSAPGAWGLGGGEAVGGLAQRVAGDVAEDVLWSAARCPAYWCAAHAARPVPHPRADMAFKKTTRGAIRQ